MTEDKHGIPFHVKLKLFMIIPVFVIRTLKYILTILLSFRPSRPLKRTIAVSLSRASALTIAPLTSPYPDTLPSTGEAIRQYCSANNIPHRTVPIPIPTTNNNNHATPFPIPPATLHLLTPPPSHLAETLTGTTTTTTATANRVLLFLHGGGYTSPLFGPSHIPFALRLAAAARAPTLALLEYGLAPGLRYPGQLVQAIETLRHLLTRSSSSSNSTSDRHGGGGGGAGYAAQDVVLAGDSAGGNLVAGLLAHLRWVCPYAAPLEGFGEEVEEEGRRRTRARLGGAVMVSPWVGMALVDGGGKGRHSSYVRNAGVDCIGMSGMVGAREQWRPEASEVWANMVSGRPPAGSGVEGLDEFWKGVFQGEGRVVSGAVVTVGDEEILLDDVLGFARIAGAEEEGTVEGGCVKGAGDGRVRGDARLLLVRSPGEAHDGAVVDSFAGVSAKHSMLSEILRWLDRL